jgi:nucleotide-binding universal stress UspA family protein
MLSACHAIGRGGVALVASSKVTQLKPQFQEQIGFLFEFLRRRTSHLQYVMLATDGAAAAERAADFAAVLAVRYGARVTVLHTVPPVPDFLGEPYFSQKLDKTLGDARALVDDVAKRMRAQGIADVDVEVVEGPGASAFLDMAETRAPDLLVVGTRGLSAWKGLVRGSVSQIVTQHAACPVLVIK